MINYELEERKKQVIEYIKKNPNATYKDIRKNLKYHIERIFKEGIAEAFKEAGVKPPRTFKLNTKEENKKIIVDYIKKHPGVGGHIILKETKRNPSSYFKSIKDAYELARVPYKKYRNKELKDEIREKIINSVRDNPLITLREIELKFNINFINFFKNFDEIYRKTGIKDINWKNKTRKRKQKEAINYIKNHPFATQREINKACKTHIQEIFKKGILEAYDKAKVEYPFERRKVHGTVLKDIRNRAKNFEEEIATKLSGFGKVNKLVKTKRGIADIILERKDKKIAIEIKDYQLKEISITQIKQLNKYLEDIKSNIGILICHKKPKKDRFLIGKNRIFVLEKHELNKIPIILG